MARIVAGVDGSPGSELALRWALREAIAHGSILEAVAVHPNPATVGRAGSRFPVEGNEEVEARTREGLDEIVDRVAGPEPGVELVRVVMAGNASERLLTASAQADLLVLGSRGLGGFKGLRLGSVARQCVSHAVCPTVVIPTPAT